MTTRKTKIPQIPQIPKDASPEVRAFLSALKEQVEVKAGQRGNTLDRNLTLRDFTDPELMAQLNIDLTPIIIPGPGGSGSGGGDTTPPGPPTDFAVVSRSAHLNVMTWVDPTDTDYRGVLLSRNSVNVFSTASIRAFVPRYVQQYSDDDYENEIQDWYYFLQSMDDSYNLGSYVGSSGPGGDLEPGDVQNFAGIFTPDTRRVTFTWTELAEADISHYEIRQGGTGWSDATVIHDRLKHSPFELYIEAETNAMVTFRIKAFDVLGQESTNASTCTVDIDTSLTEVLTPTGLTLSTGSVIAPDGTDQVFIRATWDSGVAVSDKFSHYEIRLTKDPSGDNYTSEFMTVGREYLWMNNIIPNTLYAAKVRAKDRFGNTTNWSSTETITSGKDTTACPAPSIAIARFLRHLRIVITKGGTDTQNFDLHHFELYRHTSNNSGLATKLQYFDGDTYDDFPPGLGTFYYWAKSVDYSGNKSAFSSVASDSLVSIPSTPPGGITLTSYATILSDGTDRVDLKAVWTYTQGNYFDHYLLDIKHTPSGVELVSRAATTDKSYVFEGVKSNQLYYVRVCARDKEGNASDWSSWISHTTTKDTAAPGVPSSLSLTSFFSGVRLTWAAPSDADLDHFDIYRYTSNNSASASKIAECRTTSYMHAPPGVSTYYYWVKAVDTSGNASAFSSGVSGAQSYIDTSDLANDIITAPKILDGAITTGKLCAGAVTAGKMSVGTRAWASSVRFQSYSHTQVDIFQGTIKFADGNSIVWPGSASIRITVAADDHYYLRLTLAGDPPSVSGYSQVKVSAGPPWTDSKMPLAILNVPSESNALVQVIPLFALGTQISSTGLVANAIQTLHLNALCITGQKIQAHTIDAGKLTVSKLSAITADLGNVTAGTLRSTTYTTSAGMKFDLDNGVFHAGGSLPGNQVLRWDGTTLTVKGDVTLKSGTTLQGSGEYVPGGALTAGSVYASKLVIGARDFTSNISFTSLDYYRFTASAGALLMEDGASNLPFVGGTFSCPTTVFSYYLTKLLSAPWTEALVTADASTYAMAANRAVIAMIKPTSDHSQKCMVIPMRAVGAQINGSGITAGSIIASHIQANAIESGKIKAGAVTAGKITVTGLSDINANLGTVTAGTLQSGNWSAGAGSRFLLGDGTIRLGGSSSPALSWDGITLKVRGEITVVGGTGYWNLTDAPTQCLADSDLALYFPFHEGDGTKTIDGSGNGRDATLYGMNTSASWVLGREGWGIWFDGSNDKIRTNSMFTAGASFTFSIWVRPAAVTNRYVVLRYAASTTRYWYLYLDASGRADFRSAVSSGTSYYCPTVTTLQANKWSHLCCTFDNSTKTAKIYLNGKLEKETTGCTSGYGNGNNAYLYISNSTNCFSGKMDEVKLYNVCATPREVAALANYGPSVARLTPLGGANLPAITPGSNGLHITREYMGYYNSGWKTYFQNNGNFYFTGNASNYISWNGTALTLKGTLDASDIKTGSLDVDRIEAESIHTNKLIADCVTSMASATITGNHAWTPLGAGVYALNLSEITITLATGTRVQAIIHVDSIYDQSWNSAVSIYLQYYNGSSWATIKTWTLLGIWDYPGVRHLHLLYFHVPNVTGIKKYRVASTYTWSYYGEAPTYFSIMEFKK